MTPDWCFRTLSISVALVACVLSGCTETEPPPVRAEPSRVRLEVVDRLLPHEGERKRGTSRECAVGDEIRPAHGCPVPFPVRSRLQENGSWRFNLSPRARGRHVLLQIRARQDKKSKWKTVRTEMFPKAPPSFSATLSDEREITATAFVLPEPRHRMRSRPVSARSGMTLQGGFALDPLLPAERSAAVRFEILARVGTAPPETIHEEVLSPDASDGWHDYSISLDRWAGEDVRFEFVTQFPGLARAGKTVAPLWSRPLVLAPTEEEDWNFVLVSLDTVRADHLGAYGASENPTPVLDRLAASGAVLERVSTTFPSTTASHMSLFTGLYPSVHEVVAPGMSLDPRIPTLAALLASAGYRTAAVTENGMIVAQAGFAAGFDSYAEFKGATPIQTSGHVEKVIDTGVRWIEAHRDERFFLFLHTYEAHGPHTPPSPFDRFVSERGEKHAAYRGEILHADHELQRLLDTLDALDLTERTVLLVTSDHGEAFGESDAYGHGWHLTDEILHVPLLVRAPGLVAPGARLGATASLVDVAPTLLTWADVPTPPAMQGRALAVTLSAKDQPDAPVYSEMREMRGPDQRLSIAIREQDMKWVFDINEELRVFDVSSGTDVELSPVPEDLIARGQLLRERFFESVEASRATLNAPAATAIELDEDTEHQLRALGYVE